MWLDSPDHITLFAGACVVIVALAETLRRQLDRQQKSWDEREAWYRDQIRELGRLFDDSNRMTQQLLDAATRGRVGNGGP